MSTLDRARQAMQRITTDTNGFAVEATITDVFTGQSATIAMLHTKHHMGMDTDGVRVNTKNAHISFSETKLLEAGIDIRNAKDDVSLKRWRVSALDSTGVVKEYEIKETYPDETLGLIVCILSEFVPK